MITFDTFHSLYCGFALTPTTTIKARNKIRKIVINTPIIEVFYTTSKIEAMKDDKLRDSIYSERHLQFRSILVSQRKLLGLSQKGLSEKLGVHHSLIGKIEVGDRRLDALEFINYCKILEINPCKVLESVQNLKSNSL